MRKYLMAGVATAALMFGLNQAMAQSSMSGGTEKQGTTSAQSPSKGASGAMEHSKSESSKTVGQARDESGSKGTSGSMDHSKSNGSKTVGQSREQSESKGMQPSSKMGEKEKTGGNNMKSEQKMGAGSADQKNAQRENGTKSKSTTGQSREEKSSPSTSKMGAQPSTNQNNAQAPSSSSTTKMGQQPSTNEKAQGSSSTTTGSASSSAPQLTTEQRTEVREKVLASAPRENSVNFAVNVGTVVPHTVHVATVPETLVRIHPAWRGHKYFVVNDEIIIVDNDYRIIAVLPV